MRRSTGIRARLLCGCLIALVSGVVLAQPAAPANATPSPPSSATAAASSATSPHFDVDEYRVLGNTVLAAREIERVLYPLLGPKKTLDDVQLAKTALEKLYHDRGYGTAFVDIPPQTVNDGIVRLKVTEGRIERTEISGAHYFPERDVIAKLPAATPGRVLDIPALQAQLGEVNAATADRSVVPILKAGAAPGTVDIALKVNDTLPLHGSLELNDQNTVDTKPLRTIASVRYDDLFGALDSASLQYQFTPQLPDQVRVIAFNYVEHPLAYGLQPSLNYVNSNSTVPTPGTLGVLGIGEVYGARLALPVMNTAATVQSVSLEIDYKHFRNTINQNATTAFDTPISYLNLSLGYNALWRSELTLTSLSLTASAGPRGLVNSPTAFENDRYKGRANFFYLRGDLATSIKLPADFALRMRIAGQGATEPLITNEDYSIAGADGVRGYLEAEELGDKAVKSTIQLSSPGWHQHDRVWGDAFAFFDIGKDDIIDALAGEPAAVTLRSYGFGLDVLPGSKITGAVTWAKMLDTASITRAGTSRAIFFLRGSF